MSYVHNKKPSVADWRKNDKLKSEPDCSVSSRSASRQQRRQRTDDSGHWRQGADHMNLLDSKTLRE